jgi:hypothetical protein
MQILNRPQMTLGEFQGWQTETLRMSAPYLVQVQGGLARFLARRFRILERAGKLPPPPQELADHPLIVDFVSPLAKLQKMDEGRAVLSLHEAVEKFALTDPNARDNFDVDVATRVVSESMYAVPGVIRDEKAVQARRQARAQAQAQQSQLDQAAQTVDIAANASHAMQAASLAEKRGGRAA